MRSEPSQAWGEVINVLKNFRADFETLTGNLFDRKEYQCYIIFSKTT